MAQHGFHRYELVHTHLVSCGNVIIDASLFHKV